MLNRRAFLQGSAAMVALAPAVAHAVPAPDALSGPIEIVDDIYGVPHIRAATIPDAFYG